MAITVSSLFLRTYETRVNGDSVLCCPLPLGLPDKYWIEGAKEWGYSHGVSSRATCALSAANIPKKRNDLAAKKSITNTHKGWVGRSVCFPSPTLFSRVLARLEGSDILFDIISVLFGQKLLGPTLS